MVNKYEATVNLLTVHSLRFTVLRDQDIVQYNTNIVRLLLIIASIEMDITNNFSRGLVMRKSTLM